MKGLYILAVAASFAIWGEAAAKTPQTRKAAQTQPAAQQQQQQVQQQVQQVQPAQQYVPAAQQVQPVQYVPQGQAVQQQYVQPQAVAPVPQQSVTVQGGSQVPVTTVVPVQNQPVQAVSYTTVVEPQQQNISRTQRRAYRAEKFAQDLDALIRSRNFVFYPTSMQETPAGTQSNIVADYCYFSLSGDTAEVQLPAVNGTMNFIHMLNFDSPVTDYRLYPYQSGEIFTFAMQYDGDQYFARFVVSVVTGEAILLLVTPDTTMRYTGSLSKYKIHED